MPLRPDIHFNEAWNEHRILIMFYAEKYALRYNVSIGLMMQSARIALVASLEKPREHFKAYFTKVLKGKMQDDALDEQGWTRIRKGRLAPVPQSVDLYAPCGEDMTLADCLPDETVTPDPDTDFALSKMRELPSVQMMVVWHYFWDGLKLWEIGERMGFHETRAFQLLTAAKTKLRKAMAT